MNSQDSDLSGTTEVTSYLDSASDCYSEDEAEEQTGPSKRLKLSSSKGMQGAARYRTKFQVNWRGKWQFAFAVKGDPYSFNCSVCNKVISCGHQGERDVSRHANTTNHKQNVEALKQNKRLSFRSAGESQPAQERVSHKLA